ncbi:glyoxalase [Streptomyces sp. WAC 01529]|uniref:VOC family protein n=1 Tax=Streptomyces sp. WAC 01529 TaxID=2203205 RepID=UPI000F6F4F8D|nr:VOC family protein [Streptomyces sp. WAC 01529]AZM56289.1 glyoxalase [Streptomyces sp. WAC 01529]
MQITADTHLRVSRPTANMEATQAFWCDGLGLSLLFGRDAADHALRMLGLPDANWHIELTHHGAEPAAPTPTEDDLLVFYLDHPVPQQLVDQLAHHGGKIVTSDNPYWAQWGVTIEDPDGYRLVLCQLDWSNNHPPEDDRLKAQ